MKTLHRICPKCKGSFTTTKQTQKFCSPKCQRIRHRSDDNSAITTEEEVYTSEEWQLLDMLTRPE